MIRSYYHRWRIYRLAASSMLVAAFALVVHGAFLVTSTPSGRSASAVHAFHVDCHGHAVVAKPHAIPAFEHTHQANSTPLDPQRIPTPDRQLDCCTSVAAAVLPLAELLVSRDVLAGQYRLSASSYLRGLPPLAPSEPPRTTYQV